MGWFAGLRRRVVPRLRPNRDDDLVRLHVTPLEQRRVLSVTGVDAGVAQEVDEGSLVIIDGTYADDVGPSNGPHTATVSWDDGPDVESADTSPPNDGPDPQGLYYGPVSAEHYYADDGDYEALVSVKGKRDQDYVSDSTTITVRNVAPTLTVADDQTVEEGVTLTIEDIGEFTDPGYADTFRYTIDWGDGTPVGAPLTPTIDTEGEPGTPTVGSFDGSHVYAQDGVYTVTVQIDDDDGGSDTKTFTVTVTDSRPTLTVVDDQTVAEGHELAIDRIGTVTGEGNDQQTVETYSYSIGWGDGTDPDQGTFEYGPSSQGQVFEGSFDGTHTYADNGTYTVSVIVYYDDGGSDFETFTVTVDNVSPTLTATVTPSVLDEGDTVTVTASFTDPGFDNPDNPAVPPEKAETFTYEIDWGDGHSTGVLDVVNVTPGYPGTNTTGSFDGTHTYADNGTYTVRVTVYDDDGGSDFETFTVTVDNVDPTLTATVTPSVLDEGDTVAVTASFSDPGFDNPANPAVPPEKAETFTYEIDWGDGHSTGVLDVVNVTPGYPGSDTTGFFDGTHTYADNGTYTVRVTVYDDDGGSDFETFTVTVDNVSPTLTATVTPSVLDEGDTVAVTASFSDPGFDNPANPADPPEKAETFTYEIDWGDGHSTGVLDVVNVTPGYPGSDTTGFFDGTHTYADNGTYTVRVTVYDDDGGSDFETFTVTVDNVSPTLTATVTPSVLDEGDTVAVTASFSDPGFDNPANPADPPEKAETFTYEIDWGDGHSTGVLDVVNVTPGYPGSDTTGFFDGTHTYADNGTYTVRVTVYDDDGGSDFQTFTVTVDNVSPTLSATVTPSAIDEGDTVTVTASFTDPGFDNPDNPAVPPGAGRACWTS